jgi:hypothetical protein
MTNENIIYPSSFNLPEEYDTIRIQEIMNKPLLIDVKMWFLIKTVKGIIYHCYPYHNDTTLISSIVVKKQNGSRKVYNLSQIKAFRNPNCP